MKKFYLILFLFFSLKVFADSVRDFNINGFEIGDSLLDHFTIDQINNSISFDYDYKNSDLFRGIEIQNVEKKSNIKMDLSMEIFTRCVLSHLRLFLHSHCLGAHG